MCVNNILIPYQQIFRKDPDVIHVHTVKLQIYDCHKTHWKLAERMRWLGKEGKISHTGKFSSNCRNVEEVCSTVAVKVNVYCKQECIPVGCVPPAAVDLAWVWAWRPPQVWAWRAPPGVGLETPQLPLGVGL